MNQNSIKEIIVYSIKEEYKDQIPEVLNELRSSVKNIPGFNQVTTFQACNDPLTMTDIVDWNSLEEAQQAMKNVQNNPEYAGLMKYFNETVYFNHFRHLL